MKFRIHGDATFEADDFRDAFRKLSAYFLETLDALERDIRDLVSRKSDEEMAKLRHHLANPEAWPTLLAGSMVVEVDEGVVG